MSNEENNIVYHGLGTVVIGVNVGLAYIRFSEGGDPFGYLNAAFLALVLVIKG